jgi:hypothetical protein
MLQRPLLYTAMSRAKELLVLVASIPTLRDAAKQSDPMQRLTNLPERLKQKAEDLRSLQQQGQHGQEGVPGGTITAGASPAAATASEGVNNRHKKSSTSSGGGSEVGRPAAGPSYQTSPLLSSAPLESPKEGKTKVAAPEKAPSIQLAIDDDLPF